MIADHWFRQVEKILKAMEITSDATRIRLATLLLEGKSQVWWDWVRASRDLEAMAGEEFHGLLMEKYFLVYARHVKALEFLELRKGTMTVLRYMTKFIELAHFVDDYVAMDMAKVRKFEDELKLSIWGKIVGLLLQDLDSMVWTAMAIEREVDDAHNIRDTGVVKDKKRESQPFSSNLVKKQRTSILRGFQGQGCGYQGQGQVRALDQTGKGRCFHCHQPGHLKWDCPQRQKSHSYGTRQSQSLVGCTRTQFVPPYPHHGPGETVSIARHYTRAYYFAVRPDGPRQGLRSCNAPKIP